MIAARERWLRRLGWLLLVALILAGLRLWPKPPLSAWAPQSRAVLAADGSLLRLTVASDEQYRLWTPLERISPVMVEAMLLQEDQWFRWHPGVNPVSLLRGAWSTYLGGVRQGGSTLTMQLARLMYRLDSRDPLGKLRQSALALWLEARYSKRELLEAYLNLAPFGGNLQGVAAAGLIYFDKPAAELSLAEALTLAVIPQQPSLRPARQDSLESARERLRSRWRERHPHSGLSAADFALSVARPARMPFAAPHLVEQLLPRAVPGEPVPSTLEPALQRLLERQLRAHLAAAGRHGVRNAAAILVDSRDMAVKALVGSADYFDAGIHGQVNGVLAKRSPGSTLKPFIYALGLDQGVIHPLSMLKDAPRAFGPFAPENFDGRFAGPLPARDALNRSRNVPAVWLAAQLSDPDLHGLLRAAGVSGLRSRQHYGLALALGGGDLTAEELAGLYAMLANGGELRPLRYRQDAPVAAGTRLLSPQAAWLTLEMLAARPRPDGSPGQSPQRWFNAWKTGTSWGFRDAWTAGVVGPYVLVVWVGNFDGAGNPALVGLDTAAPLWLRVADALPLLLGAEPVRPLPAGLRQVEICSASGELPNAWCPRTEPGWFIPGRSPIRVSDLHRPVWVDAAGRALCPPYGPEARQQVYEFWSSDLAQLFRQAGLPRRAPPAPPRCDAGGMGVADGEPPRISSPMSGLVYQLRPSRQDQTLALNAHVGAEVKAVFWFADARLLGRTAPGEALNWRPERGGRYWLTATDDRGRSASREVVVELMP